MNDPKSRYWLWLSLTGGLALGLRLAHVWFIEQSLGTAQIQDAAYYHDVALGLLGRLPSPDVLTDVAFASVGYSRVLAWLYVICASPTWILLCQAVMGAGAVVLTGVAAHEAFGSRETSLWASALYAVYAPAIFYDGLLLTPSLSALCSAVLLWSLGRAIRQRSWPWAIVAGLAIGAATLLRASQLLLLVGAWPALFRSGSSRRVKAAHVSRWPAVVALTLATLVTVAPLIVQQRIASRAWVPVTANSGMNLWIGNHRGATGRYTDAPFTGLARDGTFQHTMVSEREGFLAEARRRTHDPTLSLAGSSRFWWHESARELAADPASWLRLIGRKWLLLVNNYEPRTNASFDLLKELSPVLGWNPFRFGGLLILGVVGGARFAISARLQRNAMGVIGPIVVVPALTCLTFFVSGEYRHAASPALVILAALGLRHLRSAVTNCRQYSWPQSWRTSWRCWLVALVAATLTFQPIAPLGPARDRKAYAEALASPDRAGNPPTLERYELASALIARHGATFEDNVLGLEATLLVASNQAIQFRDPEAARRLIATARELWGIVLEPSATFDGKTIERIRKNSVRRVVQLCRQGFVAQWPDIERDLNALGCHAWDEAPAGLASGQRDKVRQFLDMALTSAPNSPVVLAYRGQLEAVSGGDPSPWLEQSLLGYPKTALPFLIWAARAREHGHPEQAIAILQRSVSEAPYDETVRYTLGDLMLEHASPPETLDYFETSILRDDKPQTSHYFMAMALAKQGRDDRAVYEFQQALAIDPAHELSQRGWGLLLERRGQLVPALEHMVEATRIHPEYRAALEDVARLAGQLGYSDDARRWQQRALAANPNTPRRFVYWARYLHAHGRDKAALRELERRLDVEPRDAEAIELRRAIHEQQPTQP